MIYILGEYFALASEKFVGEMIRILRNAFVYGEYKQIHECSVLPLFWLGFGSIRNQFGDVWVEKVQRDLAFQLPN